MPSFWLNPKQFNCTAHPSCQWIAQQLREALPLPCPYRYVLFDHDAKLGHDVFGFLLATGMEPTRTSVRSPWQSGVAEGWVSSVRRKMLEHVIPINERHLRRLRLKYLTCYHEDSTHIGLDKATPSKRTIELRPTATSHIQSRPRIGGLHHRYYWAEAA